jgi:hypothetical protein
MGCRKLQETRLKLVYGGKHMLTLTFVIKKIAASSASAISKK